MKRDSKSSKKMKANLKSLSTIAVSIAVTVIGGIILALILGEGRFTSEPASDKFSGLWIDEVVFIDKSDTRDIEQFHVIPQGNSFDMDAWGSCSPDWCYLGMSRGKAKGSKASVEWTYNFVEIKMEFTLLSPNRMEVRIHQHFIDNSGRDDLDTTSIFLRTNSPTPTPPVLNITPSP